MLRALRTFGPAFGLWHALCKYTLYHVVPYGKDTEFKTALTSFYRHAEIIIAVFRQTVFFHDHIPVQCFAAVIREFCFEKVFQSVKRGASVQHILILRPVGQM
jgi:hypothetical protein